MTLNWTMTSTSLTMIVTLKKAAWYTNPAVATFPVCAVSRRGQTTTHRLLLLLAEHRVGFGMTTTRSMLHSLVAVTLPDASYVDQFLTSSRDQNVIPQPVSRRLTGGALPLFTMRVQPVPVLIAAAANSIDDGMSLVLCVGV